MEAYPEKFINNSAKLCDFSYSTVNIIFSGITYPSKDFIHKNDYIPHYNFEYITSGKGYTYVEGKKYTLTQGDLSIISPNQTISFNSDPDDPYERMFICPYGSFLDALCSIYKITPPIFIKKADVKSEFQQIIDSMENYTYSEILWNKLIFEIIIKATNVFTNNTLYKPPTTTLIHSYIENHYLEINSLDEIANNLHISKSTVSSAYKKEFGMTPYNHILKKRMSYALSLLKNTSQPISQIAETVKFNSTSFFIKQFKKDFGITPSQYRKRTDTE